MIQIFHRIRELKAKYGLSNLDLASVVNCSENSIINKLNGKRPFDVNEATALIKYFINKGEVVTFEDLFFNKSFSNESSKGA